VPQQESETGWLLTVYPDAREGAGVFRWPFRPEYERAKSAYTDAPYSEERVEAIAVSRAKGKVRRFCIANGLTRLGTLTYAGEGCHDPRQLRSDLGEFFRALRVLLGGKAFAYLWVPEWHPGGHGLHAHFAVGRYIKKAVIEDAWGRGYVHIKLLCDLPVGTTKVHEAAQVAWYLSKYMDKAFAGRKESGLHRYEVAQHFQPASVRLTADTLSVALERSGEVMGGRPTVSMSTEWPNWTGPLAVGLQWPG
ncbi:MAG TPA: hypothetical protein VHW93_04425, partial [Acidimicrobiales bacterium]|nr:hypothetical protein [Acidimicrobiales bacterium]